MNFFEGDDLLTPISRRRGIPIGNLTSQFFANTYGLRRAIFSQTVFKRS